MTQEVNSSFETRFFEAIEHYGMVRPGDRVLLAVSGGKDSYSMLELFCRYRESHFKDVSFLVSTIETDLTCSGSIPGDVVRQRAFECGMDYEQIFFPLAREAGERGIDCFYCSLRRRTALIKRAFASDYNVLALGHHLDDIVETLLMNMMHHANISTMSPRVDLFKGRIRLIRPLAMISEEETRRFAHGVTVVPSKKPCPGAIVSTRRDTKQFLDRLEAIQPGTRLNFFRSLQKIERQDSRTDG